MSWHEYRRIEQVCRDTSILIEYRVEPHDLASYHLCEWKKGSLLIVKSTLMMSTYGLPWCRDGISITNLQMTPPRNGDDAWGREKDQPVLLSIRLSFKSAFDTAAENDAVDSSTMHYGILAKALRGMKPTKNAEWGTLPELSNKIFNTVAATLPDRKIMESLAVEIKLPKGSLMGDAVVLHSHFAPATPTQHTLHLVNLCVPALIGVNDHEREASQKLVINLWIMGLLNMSSDTYVELEQNVVGVGDSILQVYTHPNDFAGYRRYCSRDLGVASYAYLTEAFRRVYTSS